MCMQGLVQRFTSAFEETKQELQAMTDDLERSLSLTLAAKLNSAELPQRLQDANLVTHTTMAAHLKQVSIRPDLQLFAKHRRKSGYVDITASTVLHLHLVTRTTRAAHLNWFSVRPCLRLFADNL